MAKKATKIRDIPVTFGNVSIAETTCRLGIKIERSFLTIGTADELLVDRRINGKVILGGIPQNDDQKTLMEISETIEGAFDIKNGFRVGADFFSAGLTFAKNEIDFRTLAKFSSEKGRVVFEEVDEIPEVERKGETGGTEIKKVKTPNKEPVESVFPAAISNLLKKGGVTSMGLLKNHIKDNGGRVVLKDPSNGQNIKGFGEKKAVQVMEIHDAFWKVNK